ncbi:kinase-interacting protein 1-like [Salvia divinorum]|uniref:Kinase-interacting protein 1-like n=1 Tax=Salvia divinorum TaxID=28513 RepID=A0ABD1ILX2_SALDI
MLQRAANHAYSWWWASHIRTKQSKWLEQSLQDMEEKVQGMLQLIEGDGDSFAKRAEMYYRRRPELICAVEESYKVFRALADRYDLLSKDFQNANHTIATVFPEQVQFGMSDDDDILPKIPDNLVIPEMNMSQIPKAPVRDLKSIISKASKQVEAKKQRRQKSVVKSGLSEEEALEEINKLQKEILSLQTVKEFVKSSYESGIGKYWGIETQVMEMQQKISQLQDEFSMDSVIEDDEARTLMAEAALKSCQETLAMLQEKQEKTAVEAMDEYERIEAACARLQSLREKYSLHHTDDDDGASRPEFSKDVAALLQETKELEELPDKLEETISLPLSLSAAQLAHKIDVLVNKVITLETAVSSQTVLVNTLRAENDDLNTQIRTLEEENHSLGGDTQGLCSKVIQMEDKLNKVQDLNKNVESRNSTLETNFAKAKTSIHTLAQKLTTVNLQDALEDPTSCQQKPSEDQMEHVPNSLKGDGADADRAEFKDVREIPSVEEEEDVKKKKKMHRSLTSVQEKEPMENVVSKASSFSGRRTIQKMLEEESENSPRNKAKAKAKAQEKEEDDYSWQQILLSGMEDRDKILLKEYTTILRNYKEVKKKLNEMEMKERDSHFDTTIQMREFRKAISRRDQEIMNLRTRLKEDKFISEYEQDKEEAVSVTRDMRGPPLTDENNETGMVYMAKSPSLSLVEEKLRTDIDAMLDENLDFWFRFSTAFHQIQKFKTEVRDLDEEMSKLRERNGTQLKSEVVPIFKHLRDIQRELMVWVEQSEPLKEELSNRFSSLCNIQEEITKALREGVEWDVIRFSSHQAAKLQGEVLNMKQENEKVREELEAGLDHVSMLQLQIHKTLTLLDQEFGISDQSVRRSKVPLSSFIFGDKSSSKKPKTSIFSCMHPSRKYQVLRAGIRFSSNNKSSSS